MYEPNFMKKIGIGLGITIILTLLVHSGISTFLVTPYAEDHCDVTPYSAIDFDDDENERSKGRYVDTRDGEDGYLDPSKDCYAAFLTAEEDFKRNGFITILIGFVLAMVIGVFLRSSKTVSGGLIWGSLLLLVSGVIRFWEGIDTYARFAMLVLAFVALLVLGWRMAEKKKGTPKTSKKGS